MADVVPIRATAGEFVRKKRLHVRHVLAQAKGCDEVLVIGVRDGELHLRGAPNDPGNALWLMELARKRLLRGAD